MKRSNLGMRPMKVAAAFGAILLTSGCASSYDPMYAGLPSNLDGGVGQLLRYCSMFQDKGDLVTAAGLCERAHTLEPSNPAPLMQLAEILLGMNHPEQAIIAYRKIIDATPQYTDARYALGKIHIARGEYDFATAQFQAALRYTTDDARLYNGLGVAHGLIGANASAMQAFSDGLEIAPKHISLRNNMGLALVMDGRHLEGVMMLEEVAADPKSDVTSRHNLQLAYGMVTAANADTAATALEQANNSVPQEPMAPVEAVTVEKGRQMAAAGLAPQPHATVFPPLAPVPELDSERAFSTTGELESPIEVTVREDTVSASPYGDSPLRIQTARATTGDTMDANAESASAYLGTYLTADADIPASTALVVTPQASEPQVAALQSVAPTTSGGDYAVQLASYRSEARAMLGWSELRGNAPDLLDSVTPVVQRADLGADVGTVYRLRTAPTAKSDATSLCSELKARDIDCLVVKEAPKSGLRAS